MPAQRHPAALRDGDPVFAGIHDFLAAPQQADVDGRDKPGHDSGEVVPCLNLSPFAGIACYGDAMCGRFTQRYTWDDIEDLYDLMGAARNLQAHYNIAPTDPVEVVRPTASAAVELVSMRWGLVPWWWKKPLKQLPASFNARAETVADKPMFRDAFARHRCVIPASGYYEWLKRPDGRQPYFISAADGSVLSFAGLWDRWKNPETGQPMISCTIIVTDANELTRPIHDRMPVVLDKADVRRWLSGEAGTELLMPAAEHRLRMWPVSRRVNRTGSGDDDPTLPDEVAA
jgi:putative SOS response-associated peptidase YedK